jgi:hypothetical protein
MWMALPPVTRKAHLPDGEDELAHSSLTRMRE